MTVAFAVVEEEPFATMLAGVSDSVMSVGCPAVSFRGCVLEVFVPSFAVIVEDPIAVLVMLTLQAPVTSVVHCVGLNETELPLEEKLTRSLGTGTPASETETEAVAGVVPSSGMLDGETVSVMVAPGGPCAYAACGSAHQPAIAARTAIQITDRVEKLGNEQRVVAALRRFLMLTPLPLTFPTKLA